MPSNVVFSQRAANYFNVKDFGAAGDSVTDDTSAIQAAINAAHTAGQITVTPPAPTVVTTTSGGTSLFTTAGQTVYIALTYTNGRGETMVGPSTTMTTVANDNFQVTAPTFPAGVTGVNVYLSQSNGSTTLSRSDNSHFLASITSSGGTYIITGYGLARHPGVPPYNTSGGGAVFFPAGVYITQPLTIYANTHLRGNGVESTIVRLKGNTSAPSSYDLISGGSSNISNINLYLKIDTTNNVYGPYDHHSNWSINDLTLDGNRNNVGGAGVTSYCLRMYAHSFRLSNVHMTEGYSGGMLADYSGFDWDFPASMEAQLSNVKVHSCNGMGITWGGPHDSQWSNVVVYDCGSHCIYVSIHAFGLQVTGLHAWLPGIGNTSVGLLCEADDCYFYNAEVEGGDNVQVALLCNYTMYYGTVYTGYNSTGVGFRMGQQAVGSAYASSYYQSGGSATAISVQGSTIDAKIKGCQSGTYGCVWIDNEYQQNNYKLTIWQTGGTTFGPSGTNPAPYNNINVTADGTGFGSPSAIAYPGIVCFSASGALGAVGNGGYVTPGGNIMRRIQPTQALTNVTINGTGTYPGQMIMIVNESAFSVTFAPSGTSKVSSGTSAVINANSAMMLVWNSATSLWHQVQ